MRIFAESCLRDVNGERMALETASNLLVVEELLLPSTGGLDDACWPGLLSWLRPCDLLEEGMMLAPYRGDEEGGACSLWWTVRGRCLWPRRVQGAGTCARALSSLGRA